MSGSPCDLISFYPAPNAVEWAFQMKTLKLLMCLFCLSNEDTQVFDVLYWPSNKQLLVPGFEFELQYSHPLTYYMKWLQSKKIEIDNL